MIRLKGTKATVKGEKRREKVAGKKEHWPVLAAEVCVFNLITSFLMRWIQEREGEEFLLWRSSPFIDTEMHEYGH